ncbi:MAG: glycosyltransferase [Holosporaceae bacterium]|jgi:glycosyltransferase involved in cell wall biosynthesis|nr:glycosyltransferase [Holosporaceae bacterium]
MSPVVSIIVPVYNTEKWLARCLGSLLNQTLKDIEIICVNDGSLDGSFEILEQFSRQDQRVIVINQDNRGPGFSRNAALEVACGEYVGFVDSDDWVESNYFEQLHGAAAKYDASMACCSIIRAYPSGKMREKLIIKEERLYCSTIDKYRITESPRKGYVYNKIYRRSEINLHKIRFPKEREFEDTGFTIRALYFLKTLVTVPTTRYYYWVNQESITRVSTDKRRRDMLASRRDFIEFSDAHHINLGNDECYVKKKIIYKFLGIPLMKIYEWKTRKKYYLFSIIPLFEKKITL